MDIKKRIADARKVMNQKQIDCLVLAPSTDLFYMTGFCGLAMERPTFLIVMQEEAYFVLPQFEADNLQKEIKEEIPCVLWQENEDPYQKAAACIGNREICAAAGNTMPNVMIYHLAESVKGNNMETWRVGKWQNLGRGKTIRN
ncbi:MAG: aminopeptidase P family N-terminal domain-containing protein [[Clostridium] scindens]